MRTLTELRVKVAVATGPESAIRLGSEANECRLLGIHSGLGLSGPVHERVVSHQLQGVPFCLLPHRSNPTDSEL